MMVDVAFNLDDWLEIREAVRQKVGELEGAQRSRFNPMRKAELHADYLRLQRIEASLAHQIEKQTRETVRAMAGPLEVRLARQAVERLRADPAVWATHGMPGQAKLERIQEEIVEAIRQYAAEAMAGGLA